MGSGTTWTTWMRMGEKKGLGQGRDQRLLLAAWPALKLKTDRLPSAGRRGLVMTTVASAPGDTALTTAFASPVSSLDKSDALLCLCDELDP